VDDSAADLLDNRASNLARQDKHSSNETRQWLRERTIERRDEEAAARAAAAEEDRKRLRLAQELKVAKAKAEASKHASAAVRAEAKKRVAELQAQQTTAKQEKAKKDLSQDLLRKRFVDWKLKLARKFFSDDRHGDARRQAILQRLQKHKPMDLPLTPEPWPRKHKQGYIDLTPGKLTTFQTFPEIASESVARRIHGGRHPSEAASAKSAVSR
jgi:hypothetical protein